MKAYVTEMAEAKNYVVVTVYNSSKRKQYDLKIPKYFMGNAKGVEVGAEVTISVQKKK